jgi:hypothetical protein
MVIRFAGSVSVLHQIFVALDGLPRQPFSEHEWSQRGLAEDVAGKPQAF